MSLSFAYGVQGTQPAGFGNVETPTLGTNLAKTSKAIYVGGAGNIEAIMEDGSTIVFDGVLAGNIYPIRATQLTANTTATNLISLS